MLKLRVRKIGDSLGAVLPKEAVRRLHAGEGDRLLLIEGPSGGYQLTPYDPVFGKKMKKAEEIIGRYRSTLHTLSK
ncbi:MAG: AbrB/MazE/SpoVT family DNA-binding domain-containing protein [Candidatus Acidiferrales bacterium]